jgi:threonylcarbamoyladenosine tRNA methylthiotransferase MtaB
MASTPKICRFLHLSLQHGCDRILQAMNRHYTTNQYADFVAEAREKIPGLHVGTDIIAGFPGETDEDFEICTEFVTKMQFANAHIFTYSPRPGTPAATMPNRPDGKIAGIRAARLREITAVSKQKFIRSQLGQDLQVIFETSSNGMLHGWSDNYIAVCAPENTAVTGCITSLKATENSVFLNGNELPQL